MRIDTHKPKLLDLFCGAGGAGYGYMQAGFEVVGVDIKPQPRYPGSKFIQMNALDCDYEFLSQFDVIHASPPCQLYSKASAIARKRGVQYPDLVHPTRALLIASGKPYIMENVIEAPLSRDICLDGTMFGLGVIRRRAFETNVIGIPTYPRASKVEGSVLAGDFVTVCGGGKGKMDRQTWSDAMGIDWMTRGELRESIPPAYTRWIAEKLLTLASINLKPIPASNPRAIKVEKRFPVQMRLFDGEK